MSTAIFKGLSFRVKAAVRERPGLYHLAVYGMGLGRGLRGLLQGRRGSCDYLRATWSMLQRAERVAGRPINITIEPTNVCTLKCPCCETGAGLLQRPKASMSLEQFKEIIDKIAAHTNTLMMYYMGETFLNRHAYEMIRYAKQGGIPFITTCTNGEVVDPEKLVDSGLDEVSFQLSGMSQATQQVYRVGSHLDKVLHNLKETVRLKKARRSGMRITSGFIMMKHNEHEVPAFQHAMSEIGVDEAVVIDPCVRTLEQGRDFLPTDRSHWLYDPTAFEQGVLRPRIRPQNECPWIYYSLVIQVNGDVVPCCRDADGQFVMGNILRQDLLEIWNDKKFCDFRTALHNNQKSLDICRLCSGYGISLIK